MMKSCKFYFTCTICVCIMLNVFDANAQFFRKNVKHSHKKEVLKPSKTKQKVSSYNKLMKDKHDTFEGLFNIYKFQKKNKIYFEIPLKYKDRDFILASTISATSDAGDGIVGQKPHTPIHFKITFDNNRMQMVYPNNRIMDSADSNIQEAIQKSNISPIFKSFKIACYNNDSTSVVVDMGDFFASNQKILDPFDKYSKNTFGGYAHRTAVFEKSNSYVKQIKAFNDNVSIKSVLAYKTNIKYLISTIKKDCPYIAEVTRTILMLPKNPMRKRYADPRIGIFYSSMTQFSNIEDGSSKKYFTHRWRLEPVNIEDYNRGKLVEPKKPIVFYIDSNYPESWKPFVKAGVEEWNKAFEAIGFKNAIKTLPFPTKEENPEFDPDNIKYSCLRYSPIDVSNSMGPSWVDPRSGEIINASVYSYHDVAKLLRNWRFVQTAQCDRRVRTKKLDNKLFGEALKYVITHEVGHTLGLMHNMSASAAIPTDSLRSPSFTQKIGTTYSVMDYARFNYVAQPGDLEKGVKLTPPSLGLYDMFAIKWLYSPLLQTKTPEDEVPVLRKWISEKVGNPIYRYGKQQIYYNYDPSSLTEDLGDDAIKSSIYGIKNLKYIMFNLNNWVKDQDEDLSFRNEIYSTVLNQYKRYLNHVLSNIGGIYLNERLEEDACEDCLAVAKVKQKSALRFLFNQIKENDWIYSKLIDKFLKFNIPVYEDLNLKIYSSILSKVYNVKLASYKANSSKNRYTEKEYLKDVYTYTWSSLIRGRNLTEKEIVFQNEFVDFMLDKAGLVKAKKGGLGSLFGFTGEISYSDNVESLISKYDDLSEDRFDSKGFEFMRRFKVDKIAIPECVFYEYLLKIKDLASKNINRGSLSNRAHCRLLLMKINKASKN